MSNFLPCPICAMMHFPRTHATGIGHDPEYSLQLKLQQPCHGCNGGRKSTIPFFAFRQAQEEAEIAKKLVPSELDALVRMGLSVTGQPLKAQAAADA